MSRSPAVMDWSEYGELLNSISHKHLQGIAKKQGVRANKSKKAIIADMKRLNIEDIRMGVDYSDIKVIDSITDRIANNIESYRGNSELTFDENTPNEQIVQVLTIYYFEELKAKRRLHFHFDKGCIGAYLKQLQVIDHLPSTTWNLDAEAGEVIFGNDSEEHSRKRKTTSTTYRYPVQLLGSYCGMDQTWKWVWATKADGIPSTAISDSESLNPDSLTMVQDIKKFGKQYRLPTFTDGFRELSSDFECMTHVPDTTVAMICSIVTNLPYYRGSFRFGAKYFLMDGLPVDVFPRIVSRKCMSMIHKATESFNILNHKLACCEFLKGQGFYIDEDSPIKKDVADIDDMQFIVAVRDHAEAAEGDDEGNGDELHLRFTLNNRLIHVGLYK